MRKILTINGLTLIFAIVFSVPVLYASYSLAEAGIDGKSIMPGHQVRIDEKEGKEEMEEVVVEGERPETSDTLRNQMFQYEYDEAAMQEEMKKRQEDREKIAKIKDDRRKKNSECKKLFGEECSDEQKEIMEEVVVQGKKVEDMTMEEISRIRRQWEFMASKEPFEGYQWKKEKWEKEDECKKLFGKECSDEHMEVMEEIVVQGEKVEDMTKEEINRIRMQYEIIVRQKGAELLRLEDELKEEEDKLYNKEKCEKAYNRSCYDEELEIMEEVIVRANASKEINTDAYYDYIREEIGKEITRRYREEYEQRHLKNQYINCVLIKDSDGCFLTDREYMSEFLHECRSEEKDCTSMLAVMEDCTKAFGRSCTRKEYEYREEHWKDRKLNRSNEGSSGMR